MDCGTVTILCSGSSLGTYIPALVIGNRLREKGFAIDIEVVENFFVEEKKEKINIHKSVFRKSFAAALISQKLVSTPRMPFDECRLDTLLDQWKKENRRHFILFSGYWMPIMEKYRSITEVGKISVDTCFMDADTSVSWQHTHQDSSLYTPIHFYSNKEKKLDYAIEVSPIPPKPFAQRQDRLVIHGGGWGLGTYKQKIAPLESKGFLMDIVVYDVVEVLEMKEGNRYFMVDPSWSPWQRDGKGNHVFPPFGEVKRDEKIKFRNRREYHELFDIISESKGIVSKPGGATLMDSFASATPLIMLEPFGPHEQANLELWESMGFGIKYKIWEQFDFSMDILYDIHSRILHAKEGPQEYGDYYTAKVQCRV